MKYIFLKDNLFFKAIIFWIFLISFSFSFAQASPLLPQFFTVEGRLFNNGSPVSEIVDFQLEILSPTNCVLYREKHVSKNLSNTDAAAVGVFALALGAGDSSVPDGFSNSTASMVNVFSNSSAFIGDACIYNPAAGDARSVRISYRLQTVGGLFNTLSPDTTVSPVPSALVADSLQGLSPVDFYRNTITNGQTRLNALVAIDASAIQTLIDGTSTQYVTTAANGAATMPTFAADPTGAGVGQIWFNSTDNSIRYQSSVGAITLQTSNSGVQSIIQGPGISVTNPMSVSPTVALAANGIMTSHISNNAVTNDKIASVGVGKITSATGAYFTYEPNGNPCTSGQTLIWIGPALRWDCANAGVSDHGLLTGLADDDHTQYALNSGRAGGQTLRGGTTSGDDLILDSTSNNAKGYVLLQPTSGNVGIGVTAPERTLHVHGGVLITNGGSIDGNGGISFSDSANGTASNLSSIYGLNGGLVISGQAPVNNNPAIFIQNVGDVGIGNIAPTEKLDIAGNLRVDGNIISTGNISTTGSISSGGDVAVVGTVLAGYERITSAMMSGNSATASCTAGKRIIGGGCSALTVVSENFTNSYPSSDTTWQCRWQDAGGPDRQAYAICARFGP